MWPFMKKPQDDIDCMDAYHLLAAIRALEGMVKNVEARVRTLENMMAGWNAAWVAQGMKTEAKPHG